MANLKISVLNVGHGDFIYAVTPLGQNLVIDCGSGGGDVSPSSFLSKIAKIDELQISHPHTDHFDDIIAMSKKTIYLFKYVQLIFVFPLKKLINDCLLSQLKIEQ